MISERIGPKAALVLILVLALAWRLVNLGFGLPSLYDPDEPMFMITALKLLKEGTYNPGWFGHPGSTTIYLLALIDVVVVVGGLLAGRFANVDAFAAAAYADPGLLFIPSRLAMVALGVACVWLTYLVARRLFGYPTALIAAALLAFNPLHIFWSQVIRTDIHATVFMLACVLFSLRIIEEGRLRHYVVAGAFVGLAAATKWPSALVAIAIIGACAKRCLAERGDCHRQLLFLAVAALASLVALFLASPYIFLDWQTVLSNLHGEARSAHLDHTGRGFFPNLGFYLGGQIAGSMGWLGLVLAFGGMIVAPRRNGKSAWILLPTTILFVALICSQDMIWSRWVLPVLPFFAIYAAVAVVALAGMLARALPVRHSMLVAVLFAIAAAPSLAGAWAGSVERANDTRDQAADWARANIPAGSTVVLEHLALKLRDRPWTIIFPIGDAGCVDGIKLLKSGVNVEDVAKQRRGSPIVDLGNVSPTNLASCRADFAILTYYDLYLIEAAQFPRENETYARLLSGGRTVALFRPRKGVAGGPVVRIVAMKQQPPRQAASLILNEKVSMAVATSAR